TNEHETSVLTPNTPRIHLTTFLNLEHQRTQEVGLRDTRQAIEVKLVKATTPEVLDIEEAVLGLSVVLPFDINTGSGSASSFSGTGYSATQDAAIAHMVTDLLRLSPYGSRPLLQSHWSSHHVSMGMVETHPMYPSSLIVHTNSGYRRARDFRTDSKYTEDTFDHVPQPGTPKNPGSGSKGHQLGQ
ncbi:hypothetical protein XENOCAPTIV_025651, partial [Xenoophorus captivus]